MKILVTGAAGLIGSRFLELAPNNFELTVANFPNFDLRSPNCMNGYSADLDAIINFAAYTNVNEAEKQRNDMAGDCWLVNVIGVKNLADFAKKNNIYFIQISTDYVFSDLGGKIGHFAETTLPEQNIDNLCWYGHTKAVAENYIRNTLNKYAIVRTAYPYRVAFEQRLDFARTIIDLYKKNNLYPYFADQQITPIFIDELCSHLIKILNNRSEGTFHLASSNLTTPFDFGSYIIEKVFGVKNVLKKGSLVEFLNADKNRPRKPIKGGLSTFKTTSELNISLMTWQEGIDRFVEGFLET